MFQKRCNVAINRGLFRTMLWQQNCLCTQFNNKSIQRAQTFAKVNLVWTSTSLDMYPDSRSGLQIKATFVLKFLWRSHQFVQKYKPSGGKMPYLTKSQCWRILQKISGAGSMWGWLQKFNQFFVVHWYICGKIFQMTICSVVFTVRLRMHTHGLAIDICLSVRLSVKRMNCDKTK